MAIAFWDSSALIPLCVGQWNSPQALSHRNRYEMVVWWATPVEIASGLARLLRMKQLSSAEWAQGRQTAVLLESVWWVVGPTDAVRTQALQITEKYDLRAGDAFQLAAALAWCDDRPKGRKLLTADTRLFQAALLSGFDAVSL